MGGNKGVNSVAKQSGKWRRMAAKFRFSFNSRRFVLMVFFSRKPTNAGFNIIKVAGNPQRKLIPASKQSQIESPKGNNVISSRV